MQRKEKWYSVNLTRVCTILIIIIGAVLGVCVLYLLMYGVIRPFILQTISHIQQEKTVKNVTQEDWRINRAAYEKKWQEKIALYTPQFLLSHIQEIEHIDLKCSNSKTYLNNVWNTTFRYPIEYTTTDDDSSTQIWVLKTKKELMRIYPSVEGEINDQGIGHSIEEYLGRWKINVYGSYYDELTQITLPNKTIYRLRKINLSYPDAEIAERDVSYQYIEFVNGHCNGLIRYHNVGMSDNDFFCIADSVQLKCN